MLSTMPINWNGKPWLIPAAVATDPVASPMSQLPPTIAVLMSAPLPISVQDSLAPAPCSNQPRPLAIIVGLVSVKKPMLTPGGAAARARPAKASAPAAAIASRRVNVGNAMRCPSLNVLPNAPPRRSMSTSNRSIPIPARPIIRIPANT